MKEIRTRIAPSPTGMMHLGTARTAIYVSTRTKHKVSEILHLLGNESTRLTALVDNMLRFVMDIYRDELNYLHEKKNNRRPF